MARASATDFLQNMRFHITVDGVGSAGNDDGYLIRPSDVVGTAVAGFTQVSVPQVSLDSVEYREGHFIYARKYPGMPSVDNVTMSRGAAKKDTSFWNWLLHTIEGNPLGLEYRMDFTIHHYQRNQLYSLQQGVQEFSGIADVEGARQYQCKNSIPTRCKLASDLDSGSADVSIMELEAAVEFVKLVEAEDAPAG